MSNSITQEGGIFELAVCGPWHVPPLSLFTSESPPCTFWWESLNIGMRCAPFWMFKNLGSNSLLDPYPIAITFQVYIVIWRPTWLTCFYNSMLVCWLKEPLNFLVIVAAIVVPNSPLWAFPSYNATASNSPLGTSEFLIIF